MHALWIRIPDSEIFDQLAVLQNIDIAIDIPEEERYIIMPVVLQALRNHLSYITASTHTVTPVFRHADPAYHRHNCNQGG